MNKISTALKALVMVAVVSVAANAGTYPNLGVKVGAGINNTDQTGSASSTRIMGGAFVEHEFQQYVAGQLELLYNSYSNSGLQFAFLEIPVLFKSKFDVGNGFKPYLMVGPELLLKLKDDTNTLKGLSFGLLFGGGAEYWFTPKIAALVELRYGLGLSSIVDSAFSATSVKYKSFQILGGVSFVL